MEESMQLPRAEHQVADPIAVSLNTLVDGTQKEIELAASLCFYDDDDPDGGASLWQISQEYSGYFKQTAEEISAILGNVVFQGRQPEAMEWTSILGADPNLDEIAVWEKDDLYIYLQMIWEDEDCPIVVLLGKAPRLKHDAWVKRTCLRQAAYFIRR
jgi:hypothetical protein